MSEQWERGEHPAQAEVHEPVYITEAEFERFADRRIQKRLQTDSRYRNAENAEDQAAAENAIEREVVADLERTYRII